MNTAADTSVEVRVETATQLEDQLNAAIQHLQPQATRSGHGILVTRLNPGHFTISVSDEVPFGLTRERSH
ncbi:hypothetical protein HP499_22885 [Paenarthrobacter sp. CM16]|uniref:hypothetical protein n=1 Tax=Paenarthrobacter sp. CM16 TaxID=2738447 RepID=UPI001551E88D|nr:hypothetical protein [Paenarthrobacter sp. CM16]NQD90631.1 hypothetical protein [Paenarthrobacter sp. CM16]